MSWQLLIPVVEKIIDAGLEYYNSEGTDQSTSATQVVAESGTDGASILLAVEFPGSEEELREKLTEALGLVDNLSVRAMEVKKNGS